MITAAAVVLIAVGIWIYWATAKFKAKGLEELNRYEFEHRTEGGVVQFKTYEEAVAHQKSRAKLMNPGLGFGCGCLLVLIGIAILILTLLLRDPRWGPFLRGFGKAWTG